VLGTHKLSDLYSEPRLMTERWCGDGKTDVRVGGVDQKGK
jgi:hypothetical protein